MSLVGIGHSLLVWNGDILLSYAVIGIAVQLVRKANLVQIWTLAFVTFAFSLVYRSAMEWMQVPEQLLFAYWMEHSTELLRGAQNAYCHGTWMEAFRWRTWEWTQPSMAITVMTIFECLPLILLGKSIWMTGALQKKVITDGMLKNLFHLLFWSGMAISMIPESWWGQFPQEWWRGWQGWIARGFMRIGVINLALGYCIGVIMLLKEPRWSKFLNYLAPCGQMTLTNYITQSIVCTWIFNGYGLRLWMKLTPAAIMLFGVGLYAVQVYLSKWYLGRYKKGPLEWLWHKVSMGTLKTIARETT